MNVDISYSYVTLQLSTLRHSSPSSPSSESGSIFIRWLMETHFNNFRLETITPDYADMQLHFSYHPLEPDFIKHIEELKDRIAHNAANFLTHHQSKKLQYEPA